MENNIPQEWNKFYLKDVSFVNLMMRRIYNVHRAVHTLKNRLFEFMVLSFQTDNVRTP